MQPASTTPPAPRQQPQPVTPQELTLRPAPHRLSPRHRQVPGGCHRRRRQPPGLRHRQVPHPVERADRPLQLEAAPQVSRANRWRRPHPLRRVVPRRHPRRLRDRRLQDRRNRPRRTLQQRLQVTHQHLVEQPPRSLLRVHPLLGLLRCRVCRRRLRPAVRQVLRYLR